jgi:8-oxo-dGTP pyrophosphatase MutT (NUDIX family)
VWTYRRKAARVVLLDAGDRVLLLETTDPADASKGTWWELPGGGIEHGESSGRAAVRELYEETGIRVEEPAMGPCVWTQHAQYVFAGIHFDSHDHIHVGRTVVVDGGRPDDASGAEYRPAGLEAIEAMAFHGFRWWTLADLVALAVGGGKIIPPWLPDRLADYLAQGPPPDGEPIDLGELGPIF